MGWTGTNLYPSSSEAGISTMASGTGGDGGFVLLWTSMVILTSLPAGIDRLGLLAGVEAVVAAGAGGAAGSTGCVGLISSGGAFRGSRPFRANLTSLVRRTFDPCVRASVDFPFAPVLVAGAFGSS